MDAPDTPAVVDAPDAQPEQSPVELPVAQESPAPEPQPVEGDGQPIAPPDVPESVPEPTDIGGDTPPPPITPDANAGAVAKGTPDGTGGALAVDIAAASGVDAEAIQAAYDEAERLEQQANGTPWPTHDITTGLCTASTTLIEPEQPSDPKFDRVPQKQILRTQQ